MTTKREQLARAACRIQCPCVHPALVCEHKCTAHPDSTKLCEHLKQVDAILAELREPDEKMQEKGLRSVTNRFRKDGGFCGDEAGREFAMECWQAMIDAIE